MPPEGKDVPGNAIVGRHISGYKSSVGFCCTERYGAIRYPSYGVLL
jgi:hypothetical protein